MHSLLNEWEKARSSSLARNAMWIFFGQGLSVVCQSVYFILLAKLLGVTEYGIYAGVFSTVAIISVYSSLGSSFTLLRHVSRVRKEFALYWGNVLMTTIALGAVFTGVLVAIVPRVAHSYTWNLVVYAAVGDCFCGQLTDACSRVFQAFEKMRITAFLGFLTNLLRTILAGVLLSHLHHATAQVWVVAALIVSLVVAITALTLVTRQFGKPKFSFQLLRNRTGEGIVFALSSSTMSVYNNIDKAMLGHYGMNIANGIYSMAYRVIDVATMPIGSIHAAAFPRFFQKGIGGVNSTTTYALQILKRTVPLAIVLIAFMVVAAPILPILLGKSFQQSVLALRWLCAIPLFRSFQLSAGDALTGSGRLKLRLGIQIAAAIFNVGANLYLIPHFGWLGAAWSSLVTDGLLGIFNWTALLIVLSRAAAPQLSER
jgi:O-antigen/teichoic acid export membrane protein